MDDRSAVVFVKDEVGRHGEDRRVVDLGDGDRHGRWGRSQFGQEDRRVGQAAIEADETTAGQCGLAVIGDDEAEGIDSIERRAFVVIGGRGVAAGGEGTADEVEGQRTAGDGGAGNGPGAAGQSGLVDGDIDIGRTGDVEGDDAEGLFAFVVGCDQIRGECSGDTGRFGRHALDQPGRAEGQQRGLSVDLDGFGDGQVAVVGDGDVVDRVDGDGQPLGGGAGVDRIVIGSGDVVDGEAEGIGRREDGQRPGTGPGVGSADHGDGRNRGHQAGGNIYLGQYKRNVLQTQFVERCQRTRGDGGGETGLDDRDAVVFVKDEARFWQGENRRVIGFTDRDRQGCLRGRSDRRKEHNLVRLWVGGSAVVLDRELQQFGRIERGDLVVVVIPEEACGCQGTRDDIELEITAGVAGERQHPVASPRAGVVGQLGDVDRTLSGGEGDHP